MDEGPEMSGKMRKSTGILLTLTMLLLIVTRHDGAISEATAIAKTKLLFGNLGVVGRYKEVGSSVTKYYIGIKSDGCLPETPITTLAIADNDWQLALDKYATKPIKINGPFKGTITLQGSAVGEGGLKSFQWMVDNIPYGPPIDLSGLKQEFIAPLKTTDLTNGFHIICGKVTDLNNLSGSTAPIAFRVDQTIAGNVDMWRPGTSIFSEQIVQFRPSMVFRFK